MRLQSVLLAKMRFCHDLIRCLKYIVQYYLYHAVWTALSFLTSLGIVTQHTITSDWNQWCYEQIHSIISRAKVKEFKFKAYVILLKRLLLKQVKDKSESGSRCITFRPHCSILPNYFIWIFHVGYARLVCFMSFHNLFLQCFLVLFCL